MFIEQPTVCPDYALESNSALGVTHWAVLCHNKSVVHVCFCEYLTIHVFHLIFYI